MSLLGTDYQVGHLACQTRQKMNGRSAHHQKLSKGTKLMERVVKWAGRSEDCLQDEVSKKQTDAESRIKKGNKQQCMGVSDFKHLVALEIPVWHGDDSDLAPSASPSVGTRCPHFQ